MSTPSTPPDVRMPEAMSPQPEGTRSSGVPGEARQVASAAAEEAGRLTQESRQQAQNLVQEARSQVDQQARTQRDRLVGTLHAVGEDLEKLANGEQPGSERTTRIARQLADHTRQLGDRLDGREPTEILEEVRAFARRRPGTFLLAAAAAGVLAGRLTRGARDAEPAPSEASSPNGWMPDTRVPEAEVMPVHPSEGAPARPARPADPLAGGRLGEGI